MNFQKEGKKKKEGEKRESWGEGEERSGGGGVLRSKLCVDWLLKKEGQDKNERLVEPKPETETESLNVWLIFQKS